MKYSSLSALVAVLAFLGQARPADISKPTADAPFQITTRKESDRVKVLSEGDRTIVVITSPFGISNATIARKTENWPKAVVLRLDLRGLESLSISNGKIKLGASVLSHGDNMRLLHLSKDGKEGPRLEKRSPYWTEIKIFNAEGEPIERLPDKGGYFEMTLPRALFKDNPKSVHLGWIDFYRR